MGRDYNDIVEKIRAVLVALAGGGDDCTAVLMQGSGTFAVESTLGSVVPPDGKVLVMSTTVPTAAGWRRSPTG